MIYRKPHEKSSHKSIKKIQSEQQQTKVQIKKFTAKPAPNMNKPPKIPVKSIINNNNLLSNNNNNVSANNNRNKTVSQKVQQLQKLVQKISNTKSNENMQQILLRQIKGIKSQLSQIKTQIGMNQKTNKYQSHNNQQQQYHNQQIHHHNNHFHNQQHNDQQQEENIMNLGSNHNNYNNQYQNQNNHHNNQNNNYKSNNQNNNNGSQLRQLPINNNKRPSLHNNHHQQQISRPNIKSISNNNKKNKVLLDIGKIQPYMKQFKLENNNPKIPQPFYYGYHKKSSKPVIVKYCQDNNNMDFVKSMYQRLWKNIVKAKTICINKIYDLNQPLATNILVIQQNKCGLQGIQMNPFKISQQILKALQFFHQCGYLYRNLHPSHIMLNYENNIVLLDLKNMKKFVDIKGKVIDLKGNNQEQQLDEFVSNSRIKNSLQGRKDDLQCLGYLTLFMLQGKLPWTVDNMIQVRSKLLLNQIFGKYPGLLKYMIQVHKLPTHQTPNYNMLLQLIQQ